jgi:hypothetical protein
MRAMNSRWFLVQVTTLKRVNMETRRERELEKELHRLRAQVKDLQPRRDNLLRLVGKLQKLQSSGPPAKGARSVSAERAYVAHAVMKYLEATGSAFGLDPPTYTCAQCATAYLQPEKACCKCGCETFLH